ncbi:MAG: hypothetical protein Q9221_007449 [Calogaya cf. arnoldii]
MADTPSSLASSRPGTTGMSDSPNQRPGTSQFPRAQEYFITTGETFIGITCMLLVLCTAAVVGRLYARRMTKARLEADDYTSLLALLLLVIVAIENILFAHYFFQMQSQGPPKMSALHGIGHLNLANAITYGLLMTAARCSVLLLYRRIFTLSNQTFKWLWWTFLWLVLGYLIALLVGMLLQCRPHPVSALWWNPQQCHGSGNEIMIMGFLNAAVDVLVLVLPIRSVLALQLPLGRKLMVCGLFGMGSLWRRPGLCVLEYSRSGRGASMLVLAFDPATFCSGIQQDILCLDETGNSAYLDELGAATGPGKTRKGCKILADGYK